MLTPVNVFVLPLHCDLDTAEAPSKEVEIQSLISIKAGNIKVNVDVLFLLDRPCTTNKCGAVDHNIRPRH